MKYAFHYYSTLDVLPTSSTISGREITGAYARLASRYVLECENEQTVGNRMLRTFRRPGAVTEL